MNIILNKDSIQSIAVKQLEDTKAVYLLTPQRMFSEFEGERENVKNYNNRQLLEMLQNSDDAAIGIPREKKVLIKLEGNTLTIANTGHPFSKEGLNSLFYSHLSPKQAKDHQIGKKGLGFRSILSWSSKVTIKSHELCVSFSKEYSIRILQELLKNDKFKEYFEEQKKDEPYPISTLICPQLEEDSVIKYQDLIVEYDTIIQIQLRDNMDGQVATQIKNDVDGEILLFLNNLERIDIEMNGENYWYKKEKLSNEIIQISNSFGSVEKWNIHSLEGEFQELSKEYNLSVAWKDDFDKSKNVMYSYFRTKVPIKCNGIIHGSFELNADRNLIINDEEGYNRRLVGLLPKLIAESAGIIAKNEDSKVNYKALQFTDVDFLSLNSLVEDQELKKELQKQIKLQPIFPVTSDKYICWDDDELPVFYKDEIFSEILDPEAFPDVLLFATDDFLIQVFNELGSVHYLLSSVVEFIVSMRNIISVKKYAQLIQIIHDNDDADFNLVDELFYDRHIEHLSVEYSIFLPDDNAFFDIPGSIKIQIINNDLVEELLKLNNVTDSKELVSKLSKFRIKEFNFNEVVELLLKHYEHVSDKEEVKKLHTYLYSLYKNQKKEAFWNGTDVPIITEKNSIKPAVELYLGKTYENPLASEIYHYNKEKLVAPLKAFTDENVIQMEDWIRYLEWLGVERLPRKIKYDAENEYADYVMQNYDYRNKIDNERYKNYLDFKSKVWGYRDIVVTIIDDLDNILKNNSSEKIINLIYSDNDLLQALDKNNEDDERYIEFNFHYAKKIKYITGKNMLSYLKWKIGRTNWLSTESKILSQPINCVTAAYINEDFSGLIERPEVDYDKLKKYKITRDQVDHILSLTGVHKTIGTFSSEQIYAILNKLDVEENKKGAKTIYNQIAVNYDEKSVKTVNKNDDNYKIFFESGRVYCKDGEFHPIKNVNYVNDKRYGDTVINLFNNIGIDRRRGKEKIRIIFGVNPLDNINLELKEVPEPHPFSAQFEKEIESFKPYVYVLRKDADNGNEKTIIKEIKIQIVTSLIGILKKEGEKKEFKLKPYEFFYLKERNTVYISISNYYDSLYQLKNDIHFCSAVAEVFSAIIDVDAQRGQIRELFSKNPSSRDELIRNEFDDLNLEKLKEAKDVLGVISDPKLDFWKAFFKTVGDLDIQFDSNSEEDLKEILNKRFSNNQEIITKTFDEVNFSDFDDETSLEIVYDLFKAFEITLAAFNDFHYPRIDITQLFEKQLKSVKNKNLEVFKAHLYQKAIEDKTLRKLFIAGIIEYNQIELIFDNELDYEVGTQFIKKVNEIFSVDITDEASLLDWDSTCQTNRNYFQESMCEKGVDRTLITRFLDENPSILSLFYFNDTDAEIETEFNTWIGENKNNPSQKSKQNRIKFNNTTLLFDDYNDLKEQIDTQLSDDIINGIELNKIEISKRESIGQPRKNGQNPKNGKVTSGKTASELGFLGEYIVYKYLLNYSKDNSTVKWKSKYAQDCGVNPEGMDGLGYDIEYIPKDAKYPRYVEVKVIGWNDSFHISSGEVRFGEKHKRNYEIFLIRNLDNLDELKIERLIGIFDYKGKSFSDNDLFSVQNDNFILKFHKVESSL